MLKLTSASLRRQAAGLQKNPAVRTAESLAVAFALGTAAGKSGPTTRKILSAGGFAGGLGLVFLGHDVVGNGLIGGSVAAMAYALGQGATAENREIQYLPIWPNFPRR